MSKKSVRVTIEYLTDGVPQLHTDVFELDHLRIIEQRGVHAQRESGSGLVKDLHTTGETTVLLLGGTGTESVETKRTTCGICNEVLT